MSDLVSVIIPLYNAEKYLENAITSVLRQTYPHREIIIVDDGSSDSSYKIAKQFEKYPQVKVFSQSNKGACAARNFGFMQSKGNYIQYLDADDQIAPDKIEQQLFLLNQSSTGCISSCSWAHFNDDVREAIFIRQDVWRDMKPVDWLITSWQDGGMMQTACWLTPRNLIEKAGVWDESLKQNPNDDGEFFCRVLLQSNAILFCLDAKVFYRRHIGQRVSAVRTFTAVDSLLKSYISYQKNILQIEKSARTVAAVIHNYAAFMYEFYDTFPSLCRQAETNINELGYTKIKPAGGRNFKLVANSLGFSNTLKMRSFWRKVKGAKNI